jgi:tetratricopeptide (TPR) repeat protein
MHEKLQLGIWLQVLAVALGCLSSGCALSRLSGWPEGTHWQGMRPPEELPPLLVEHAELNLRGEPNQERNSVPTAVQLTELMQKCEQEPTVAKWHLELARTWFRAGQLLAAEQAAAKAIGLDQNCAGAWLIRGDLAAGRLDWEEAVSCYQQAVSAQEESASLLILIGNCYAQMDQPRRALSAFERAEEISPDRQLPHAAALQRGRVLADLRQYRRAVDELRAALAQPQATPASWVTLCEVQVMAGEAAEARATVAQALEKYPAEPQLVACQESLAREATRREDGPVAIWR